MANRRKVLVYHIGSLGDPIASVPALRSVRRKYGKDADITLLSDVGKSEIVKSSEVLEGSGLIDHYLEYQQHGTRLQKLQTIFNLWLTVTKHRFQDVVYLMQSERTAEHVKRDETFFKLCGIPNRLGFEAFSKDFLYPRDKDGYPMVVPHEAQRRANRLKKFGFDGALEQDLNDPFLKAPDLEISAARAWLAQYRKAPHKILVGFCPGTKMPAKLWLTDRFAEIGRRLLASDQFEIVVVGGPNDNPIAVDLLKAWGSGLNACGGFSVMGSAALLHQCGFVISVDSGPMHMAAAGGIPCVALFSSIDYPGRFSPLGRNHVLIRHGHLSCAACRLNTCPKPDHPCMTGIQVDEVWTGVKNVCKSIGSPIAD